MKNYYAILEVPVGAGLEEIRQAYHRLTQDHLDDDGAFADLKEAFEVLSSPAQREAYDRAGTGTKTGQTKTSRCPLNAGAQCPVLNAQVTAADTFCPECGGLLSELSESAAFEISGQAMARLEEANGTVYTLRTGRNIVGRENADVPLADKTVSRQHASLELGVDGSVTLEDLGSTNGTQVNDVPLVPPVQRRLADGDRLRFGSVATTLSLPPADTAANKTIVFAEIPLTVIPLTDIPTTEMPMPEMPMPELLTTETLTVPLVPPAQVVDIREGNGQVYPLLPGVTTFGRRVENNVVLTGDPYVSGSHARITFLEDQYVLTDSGSTNGTLLNGNRLVVNMPTELTHGDVILIGAAPLRFEIIGMPLDEEITDEEITDEDLEDDLEETASAETTRPSDLKPLEG